MPSRIGRMRLPSLWMLVLVADAKLPSLSLYVHWPFCTSICPYCDFNVHIAAKRKGDDANFLAAYKAELDTAHKYRPKGRMSSIFFGGGTPSLMAVDLCADIIEYTDKLWGLESDAEISLEANPDGLTKDRLKDFAGAGINRLSLGVQSLDEAALKMLGRRHSPQEAQIVFEMVQQIFPKQSFDLIYARPQQKPRDWQDELTRALAFAPQHMSLYQLTIEPDTHFARRAQEGRLAMPSEDEGAVFYEITQELCEQYNLPAYEISNHACTPKAQCQHNLLIWRGGDYIGIGAGAHGRLTVNGKKYAFSGEKNPQKWLSLCHQKGSAWGEKDQLSNQEVFEERLLLGLRLQEGVPLTLIHSHISADILAPLIAPLITQGYLQKTESHLRATKQGLPIIDHILMRLLAR